MKRASYRHAVAFAADFDTDVKTVEEVSGLITVQLIAEVFDIDSDKVAADVIRHRERQAEYDARTLI